MTVALVYNTKRKHLPPPLDRHQILLPILAPILHRSRSRTNDVYAEWDTMDTVHAVRDAIAERYPWISIEADEDAYEQLRRLRPEFVFNIAEGLHGVSREAQIPAMLELLRIPISRFRSVDACDVSGQGTDERDPGVSSDPHGAFVVIDSMDEFEDSRVKFPSMVKPLHEGSSKGIYNSCVVRNPEDLEREVRTILETYKEPALVEEFLPGQGVHRGDHGERS